ncbi:terminase small subunit [Raoultella ornithinolytica]
MALSDKQEMLCRECLIDLNATKTAILAGCNVKIANRIVSQVSASNSP